MLLTDPWGKFSYFYHDALVEEQSHAIALRWGLPEKGTPFEPSESMGNMVGILIKSVFDEEWELW